jgi:cytochrome c556
VASGSGWSKWIAASTIEDEVKAIKVAVDKQLTTPTQFRGQDYKQCRRDFTVLAVLFAIVEQYDGEVRWKQQAPALREVFARAAANCKTGSDQAYNEAKQRKLDLEEVIGGGALNLPAGKPREGWDSVCDRSPLMQRLEISFEQKLRAMTSSENALKSDAEAVYHEAQLVAAFAQILRQSGMEDADDDAYAAHCDAMRGAAGQLAEAARAASYPQASSAVGQIGAACTACHADYR